MRRASTTGTISAGTQASLRVPTGGLRTRTASVVARPAVAVRSSHDQAFGAPGLAAASFRDGRSSGSAGGSPARAPGPARDRAPARGPAPGVSLVRWRPRLGHAGRLGRSLPAIRRGSAGRSLPHRCSIARIRVSISASMARMRAATRRPVPPPLPLRARRPCAPRARGPGSHGPVLLELGQLATEPEELELTAGARTNDAAVRRKSLADSRTGRAATGFDTEEDEAAASPSARTGPEPRLRRQSTTPPMARARPARRPRSGADQYFRRRVRLPPIQRRAPALGAVAGFGGDGRAARGALSDRHRLFQVPARDDLHARAPGAPRRPGGGAGRRASGSPRPRPCPSGGRTRAP